MIIVDLDKLHFPFTTARPEYAQGVQDLHKAILKCKIDAIPVEWIENYVACAELDDGVDGYWHMFREDVLTMIEGWKEENANTN